MLSQKLERPQTFHDLVRRLIDLGYYPVPIPAGCKGPTISGWQNLRMTQEQVADYFTQPDMLVGILHKNTCFIDIDVYDAELAEAIAAEARKRFPGCLERVGQYPKTAIVLGLDEVGFKVSNTLTAEREIDGRTYKAQVEIRTLTRQAVVYGTHPDTGELYKWINGPELWETPQADLPVAKKDEVQAFRDWADEQIRDWAGVEDNTPQSSNVVSFTFPQLSQNERASEEQFLAALAYVPADTPYEDWLQGLMAIHDFYGGSMAGLERAKQWSQNYGDYDPREVETKWRSFEVGRGTSYRSIFHMARQNGADLSEIARMGRENAAPAIQIKTGLEPSVTPENAPQGDTGPLEWFSDVQPALTDSYLIKGVIADGAMSVIYGPSNSGKTFFALDAAFHIAAGRSWRGLRVRQAAVLYLAAEGGRGIANRIVALRSETGVHDIPLALRRAGMDLLKSEADLQAIYDLAKSVSDKFPELPLLLVIDTLSRVMAGGDENSAADMTALIKNIDAIREATGAHIMLIHHSGKDTARGARGHSSLRAATDTEIELQINETDEGEKLHAAQVSKQRDYNGGETFAFGLKGVVLGRDQDGDEVTSCVVEVADGDEFKAAQKAKKGLGGNQKIVAETFDQMIGNGLCRPNPGDPLGPEAGKFYSCTIEELRQACEGKFTAKNTRDAWKSAFDVLTLERRLFHTASGFTWRPDRPIKGVKSWT